MNNDDFKDYLLGTLDGERRAALEEQILCDPAVYEQLLAAEQELIDQYVGGGLSKQDQQSFETHFLITPERHQNLRFGRLLQSYMDSHAPDLVAVGETGQTTPAKRYFPFHVASLGKGPAIAISAGLAACLGLLFLVWFVTRRPIVNTAEQRASRLMVVTLAPGSTRSAGGTKRVTVPPKGVDLKLELEVTNTSFPNYKSHLFRESQSLQTNESKMEAKGDQKVVPLTITREKLSPGDYQVKLCGVSDSGQKVVLDSYSFTVTSE